MRPRSTSAAVVVLALATAEVVAGCQVEFRDGQFACSVSADCPPGFGACVAGRCTIPDAWVELPDAYRSDVWSDVDTGGDADVDADVDASTDDASDVDAATYDADAAADALAP